MSSSQPIQLDTVVLQNCAFNLHYFDRIYQEAVNRRFAIAIRATYPTDQISVRIHCPEVCDINVVDDDEADQLDDDYLNSIEYQISGPKKRQLINQRDKKSLYGRENLRKGVQAILRRFKHFRKLRLTGYFGKTATESILLALNQPKCFPLSLSAIYFKVKKDVLIDFVLIEALASLIKKLTFVGTSERLNWTDDIWLSVANCTQLHSLDYRQETDLIDTELERMQTNLQKCLKTLQIERFRYDLPPMESFSVFDSNWIYESLKENMALRNLQISNTCQSAHINGSVIRYLLTMPLNVVSWADSTLLPIVGRLRELQVTDEPLHEVEDALKAKPGDMINLLRVKNESGVPLIITYLTYLSCGHSLQLMCVSGRILSGKPWTQIVERLKFWLHLSHSASTPVTLSFRLCTESDDDDERKRARLALASCLTRATDETPGAFIEEQCNQIVLRYQLAVVFIDVICELCQMPHIRGQRVMYHAM